MAQLASIRQMSGQVSRGSAGDYQSYEREGVARFSWRVSGMSPSPNIMGTESKLLLFHLVSPFAKMKDSPR